jgi:hypothetical protein
LKRSNSLNLARVMILNLEEIVSHRRPDFLIITTLVYSLLADK